MARRGLVLEGAALEAVEQLARAEGVSPAEVIKRALRREYAAQQEQRKEREPQAAPQGLASRASQTMARARQPAEVARQAEAAELTEISLGFYGRSSVVEMSIGLDISKNVTAPKNTDIAALMRAVQDLLTAMEIDPYSVSKDLIPGTTFYGSVRMRVPKSNAESIANEIEDFIARSVGITVATDDAPAAEDAPKPPSGPYL